MKPSARMRLARLLGLDHDRPVRRPHPAAYDEDEVRAMIYGWHSGTVEPPQPVDSSQLVVARGGAADGDDAGVAPAAVEPVDEDVVTPDGDAGDADPQ